MRRQKQSTSMFSNLFSHIVNFMFVGRITYLPAPLVSAEKGTFFYCSLIIYANKKKCILLLGQCYIKFLIDGT
jgi:hypothetical protein